MSQCIAWHLKSCILKGSVSQVGKKSKRKPRLKAGETSQRQLQQEKQKLILSKLLSMSLSSHLSSSNNKYFTINIWI